MSLSPESLRPLEIASLCPKLLDEKSVEALVVVHAAIEELQASADQLTGPLPEQQRKLSTEDESGVVELITDLRELFEHLGGHCNEAVTALWSLTETMAGRD